MLTSDFDYELPEDLIAQEPSQVRGADRMLVLAPATSDVSIGVFENNTPAHACYRKVGFTDAGITEKDPWNVIEMEITKAEWMLKNG